MHCIEFELFKRNPLYFFIKLSGWAVIIVKSRIKQVGEDRRRRYLPLQCSAIVKVKYKLVNNSLY